MSAVHQARRPVLRIYRKITLKVYGRPEWIIEELTHAQTHRPR